MAPEEFERRRREYQEKMELEKEKRWMMKKDIKERTTLTKILNCHRHGKRSSENEDEDEEILGKHGKKSCCEKENKSSFWVRGV